jgi:hypothetical protein
VSCRVVSYRAVSCRVVSSRVASCRLLSPRVVSCITLSCPRWQAIPRPALPVSATPIPGSAVGSSPPPFSMVRHQAAMYARDVTGVSDVRLLHPFACAAVAIDDGSGRDASTVSQHPRRLVDVGGGVRGTAYPRQCGVLQQPQLTAILVFGLQSATGGSDSITSRDVRRCACCSSGRSLLVVVCGVALPSPIFCFHNVRVGHALTPRTLTIANVVVAGAGTGESSHRVVGAR